MPEKKKQIKNKIPKNIFLIVILLILFLVVLILTSFLTVKTTKNLSLQCLKTGSSIKCQWNNCQSKTGASELVLAKTPDYVESIPIAKESGSVTFSPSPLAGTYTSLLSCDNGEVIQRINIS